MNPSPTKLAVSVAATDPVEVERQTAAAFAGGADLVEWRLDFLPRPYEAVELLRKHPEWRGRLLATCRHKSECGGLGGWDGGEDERLSLLQALGLEQPGHVDLELAAYERSANIRQKIHLVCEGAMARGSEGANEETGDRKQGNAELHAGPSVQRGKNKLILSWHSFQITTFRGGQERHEGYEALETMTRYPFAIRKAAWRPAALHEAALALHAAGTPYKIVSGEPPPPRSAENAIIICMGETGLLTRVLARKFGLYLSFCSSAAGKQAAPGQMDLEQMKSLYRWDQIGPHTTVYGVLGDPVAHSMSPAIHNAGFEAVGHDGVYLPLRPHSAEDFRKFLDVACSRPQDGWRGFSVTIPFKDVLLDWARHRPSNPRVAKPVQIEPLAERIGAANTVHLPEEGGVRVFNTDYAGALQALLEGMNAEPQDLHGVPAAVLGAGGTARAIVAGLVDAGAKVTLFNRTPERATEIARDFAESPAGGSCTARPWEDRLRPDVGVPGAKVIVNTTSLGMHRSDDPSAETKSPVPEGLLHGRQVVFDVVYNPLQTKLLQEAAAVGATVVDGVSMFIAQAALQFAAWTGKPAPHGLFRKIVLTQLGG